MPRAEILSKQALHTLTQLHAELAGKIEKGRKPRLLYSELAKRLKWHGFKDETEAGITMKLKRGTFSATFFLACVAALELEQVVLEET